MGNLEIGWGNNSKQDSSKSQFELRTSWEAADVSTHFRRIFHEGLLGYVGRVIKLFKPPQSSGILFEFGPGMYDKFAALIDQRAFPPKDVSAALAETFVPKVLIPDDPGPQNRDTYWRKLAAGAAIGTSFRERGTDTSVHIAFNNTLCDVHVDRNGFVVTDDGYAHWSLNNLLRHASIDLLGDKAPWVLISMTYVDRHKRPLVQATLGPWFAVDLPSKDAGDQTGVTVGVILVGRF